MWLRRLSGSGLMGAAACGELAALHVPASGCLTTRRLCFHPAVTTRSISRGSSNGDRC